MFSFLICLLQPMLLSFKKGCISLIEMVRWFSFVIVPSESPARFDSVEILEWGRFLIPSLSLSLSLVRCSEVEIKLEWNDGEGKRRDKYYIAGMILIFSLRSRSMLSHLKYMSYSYCLHTKDLGTKKKTKTEKTHSDRKRVERWKQEKRTFTIWRQRRKNDRKRTETWTSGTCSRHRNLSLIARSLARIEIFNKILNTDCELCRFQCVKRIRTRK